jgi:hypothetical protein
LDNIKKKEKGNIEKFWRKIRRKQRQKTNSRKECRRYGLSGSIGKHGKSGVRLAGGKGVKS